MNSASLRSLAGRYDNPILPRFLAPIDFLKIPVQDRLQDKWKRLRESGTVFMTSRIGCRRSRTGCRTSRIGCRTSRIGCRTSKNRLLNRMTRIGCR
jgi:hypothetical protein